jgi:hypothetical protein
MNGLELISIAGYVLALAGGFALGTLFGQKLVAEVSAGLHALELRVVAIESAFSGSSTQTAAASSAATAAHSQAIEHHAAATEKLAAAVAGQSVVTAAASSAKPAAASAAQK